MMTAILAVDPGDRRIGIAVSDPTRTLARPLQVLQHQSRDEDAAAIAALALAHRAQRIVVGLPLDSAGEIGHQARKVMRLIRALRAKTEIEVVTWDETLTTADARITGGQSAGLDARAAAVLLQGYLDAQPN